MNDPLSYQAFSLPEKFFDKVLEIERQIDELKDNTPHDLLQTLIKLYSDAIEFYGANDDNEMCIDLNMRMQSILVRPYILDCLCEHNEMSQQDRGKVKEQLGGEDAKTNFENDNRRQVNPFKYQQPERQENEEQKEESKVEQNYQNETEPAEIETPTCLEKGTKQSDNSGSDSDSATTEVNFGNFTLPPSIVGSRNPIPRSNFFELDLTSSLIHSF